MLGKPPLSPRTKPAPSKFYSRAETLPHLSNEIFGLIIESLGEDIPTLRSCSLVSSVFHHFCSPILYRNIELGKKKLESFFQLGERSVCLMHTKSLSLVYEPEIGVKNYPGKFYKILDTISQKTSLKTLRLHNIPLRVEPFTASLLSKLSTVTVLTIEQCYLRGFEDFVSFIRCFPRCQVLRLRYNSWPPGLPNQWFRDLPTYDLAPTHLEITNALPEPWGVTQLSNQGRIVGMPWLNLAGIKSFTYVIQAASVSRPVVGDIATCELLEVVDMDAASVSRNFGKQEPFHSSRSNTNKVVYLAIEQLTLLIGRIKSLTLRCPSQVLPWGFSCSSDSQFPPSATLERLRFITSGPSPMPTCCRLLDNTFSDTDRYPSLVEFELVRSVEVRRIGGRVSEETHARLVHLDKFLPRLKGLGRLPTDGTQNV